MLRIKWWRVDPGGSVQKKPSERKNPFNKTGFGNYFQTSNKIWRQGKRRSHNKSPHRKKNSRSERRRKSHAGQGGRKRKPCKPNWKTELQTASVEMGIKRKKEKGLRWIKRRGNSWNRFGADFGAVNIHTRFRSPENEWTIRCSGIYDGEWYLFQWREVQLNSSEGKHLLAHEFTHTLQQSKGIQKGTKLPTVICSPIYWRKSPTRKLPGCNNRRLCSFTWNTRTIDSKSVDGSWFSITKFWRWWYFMNETLTGDP